MKKIDFNDFLENLKAQLENANLNIDKSTILVDIDGWDSLTVMLIIGMFKLEYNVDVSLMEINDCNKVEDLFDRLLIKIDAQSKN